MNPSKADSQATFIRQSKTDDYQNENKRWQPIWHQIPQNFVSVEDYQQAARNHLPLPLQALLFENNLNHADTNAIALDKTHWLPQVLNTQMADLNCHLYNPHSAVPLDLHLPHPLWLSPVAHQGLYHPLAERATVEGATALNTPCILSSMGNTPFEQILPLTSGIKAVQWYWQPLPSLFEYSAQHFTQQTHCKKTQSKDTQSKNSHSSKQRTYNLSLINELISKGMQLLVITVDAPHIGVRSVSRRVGATLPKYCQTVNLPKTLTDNLSLAELLAQAPSWEDIAWLVAHCKIPVMLKGIMHPKDAQRAKDIGCAGILVSNHGRRLLTDVLPVATVLSEIRQQVGHEMVIIADGGIRSGSDMAKLIALGADAVAIGRGYIYGLALAGALGVAHVNKVLIEELQVTMALIGVNSLAELTADRLYQSI